MEKLKIKSGDLVLVTAGDHKGSEGKVLRVLKDKNKAIVEGINLVKKHQKPSAASPQGGISEMEVSGPKPPGPLAIKYCGNAVIGMRKAKASGECIRRDGFNGNPISPQTEAVIRKSTTIHHRNHKNQRWLKMGA